MTRRVKIFCTLIFFSFILNVEDCIAQVQTPRFNTSMASNTNGFYEYLPQGYHTGNAQYPLIISIHGNGQRGNGDTVQLPWVLTEGLPELIDQGGFPASFTVNGQIFRFIVLSPHFKEWPTPAQVEQVINYAISHYRVNKSRIYLTGISMGGGVTLDYAGDHNFNAHRLAAIVPLAPSSKPIGNRGRVIAGANLPVWITHNDGDRIVKVAKTHEYIDSINRAPGPSPMAKKTIFTSVSHDAWTKTYNPTFKENGLNVFEWMLQYHRSNLEAYSNSPVCNGSLLTLVATEVAGASYKWTGPNGFTSAMRAPSLTASTAAAGTYKVTLTKGDSTVTASTSVTVEELKTFYRDYDGDGFGNTITIKACRLPSGYALVQGDCNNSNRKVYPGAPELCDGLDNDCDGVRDDGLSPQNTYYRDSDGDGYGSKTVKIIACAPPSGYVAGTGDCNDSKSSIYPGAIEVTDGLDNNCNGVIDEAATSTPVAARSIKVNIYGGSNAYTNSEWNNWNVTGNLNSGVLRYSEASVSSISATLSKSSGVNDNGSVYGGTMAPAPVLRYASNSGTSRTLTLSGLSLTKTYSLELYASRDANSSYVTGFTVNGITQNVNTYQNKTVKASFNNIAPTSAAQLVVSIHSTNPYNYINGFKLTEESNAATISQQTAAKEKVTLLVHGLEVHAFPNPTASSFTIWAKGGKALPVSIKITDAIGRVIEIKQNLPARARLLMGENYQPGIYYLEVAQGNERKTVKLLKRVR